MTTYTLADDDVKSLVARIMQEHHPELHEAKVRIGVLMAENSTGDAIKAHGYPALACVRVVPLKDRLTKGYDVEMLIDLAGWNEMEDEHRAATVDHECQHVSRVANTPKKIKEGECAWKLDDLGRPKLKLRKGDWSVGDGFECIVARHGDYAVEFLNIQRAVARAKAAKEKGAAQSK
jgi:hypothetical protein